MFLKVSKKNLKCAVSDIVRNSKEQNLFFQLVNLTKTKLKLQKVTSYGETPRHTAVYVIFRRLVNSVCSLRPPAFSAASHPVNSSRHNGGATHFFVMTHHVSRR